MRSFLYAAVVIGAMTVPAACFAAALSLSPASGSYKIGDQIIVKVLVSSPNAPVNAASGQLSFPSSILSFESVSKAGSIVSFWPVEPSVSQSAGTVNFEGVAIPSFQGNTGTLISITFRAAHAGSGTISFNSGQVLANDGQGTDITSGLSGATFSVGALLEPPPVPSVPKEDLAAHITSSTHPVQTKWYSDPHVILDWTNAQGVTAVRLGYDEDVEGVPTVLYSDPLSHKELDLEDGVWYFHVQEKGSGGWGPVSTFRIQIDTIAPLPIVLGFSDGTTTTRANPIISFGTTDALSGIDHYRLTVDDHSFTINEQEGSAPYTLSAQRVGGHILSIEAYDKADNMARTSGTFTVTGAEKVPTSLFDTLEWLVHNYLSLVLLAVGVIVFYIGWRFWHHFHTFRKRFSGIRTYEHEVLRARFKELTEAVIEEVMTLENVRSKRELTQEEKRVIANLKKLIQKTEFSIENNILEKE